MSAQARRPRGALHRTAGCVLLPDSYYLFDAESGAQIVDQPRTGFATEEAGWLWVLGRLPDPDTVRFRVELGSAAL